MALLSQFLVLFGLRLRESVAGLPEKWKRAVHYHKDALRLDPDSREASEGLELLESKIYANKRAAPVRRMMMESRNFEIGLCCPALDGCGLRVSNSRRLRVSILTKPNELVLACIRISNIQLSSYRTNSLG